MIAKGQGGAFGTQVSEVRILSPRPLNRLAAIQLQVNRRLPSSA